MDGACAEVTVRSKDKGGRVVAWTADVRELAPDSEEWRAAVEELKGKRLNAPDAETMTARWAQGVPGAAARPSGGVHGAAGRFAGRGAAAEPRDHPPPCPGGPAAPAVPAQAPLDE